jgi:hypothetical protein
MVDRVKSSRRAHERQRVPLEVPVFCEQCPNLALVLLDESPLCRRCTLAAIADRPPEWIREHTHPLSLVPIDTPVAAQTPIDGADEVA